MYKSSTMKEREKTMREAPFLMKEFCFQSFEPQPKRTIEVPTQNGVVIRMKRTQLMMVFIP